MKHPRFNQKKILVVVAHPDDESLYFSGGLQSLSLTSGLRVLCVTQTPESERGIELLSVCNSLKINCDFLDLEDPGLRDCLPCFEKELQSFIVKNEFDLVITHPPHGGEKAHPHHLQTFLSVFSICLKHNKRFGFFSENKLSFCEPKKSSSVMKLRLWPLVSLYVFQSFFSLRWRSRGTWLRLLAKHFTKVVVDLLRRKNFFVRFDISTSLEDKRRLLKKYVSQESILQNYKASTSSEEYLFLLARFAAKSHAPPSQTEEIMTGYYNFKNSTAFWIGPH